MIVSAYHASPTLFNKFADLEHGVHVGGYASAIEAVSRKLSEGQPFYLYEVVVDTSQFAQEIDHGYDWASVFKYEPDSVKGYIYTNRYEPANEPSYVSWYPNETMSIISVSKEFYSQVTQLVE